MPSFMYIIFTGKCISYFMYDGNNFPHMTAAHSISILRAQFHAQLFSALVCMPDFI